MKRLSRYGLAGLAIGVFVTAAATALAASPYPVQMRPGFVTGNSDVGTEANLDILFPLWGDEKRLLFFNPNFRIDDGDGNEENIGFGFRRMSDCGHFILGGNLYYDTMRSERGNRYRQWGAGAEVLSQWLDLRANYYDPFGDTENFTGGGPGGYFFSGHSLLSSGGATEEALGGIDAELSVLVPAISTVMETRLAATYYTFDSRTGEDIDGWRGRVEFRPVRALNLSVEYRDDDVRGGDTIVGGFLEVPFALEKLLAGENPFAGTGDLWRFGRGVRPLNERMTDKVVRDRHIVTASTRTQAGGSGQPVVNDKMIFVNQDNPAAGDGSFENPYQTLDQAAADSRFLPGAWIYVFASESYYYNTRFTLLNDQVFWGQGYAHPTYGLGGGENPVLDGGTSGAPVITLADNNEVMGFTVQKGGHGIYGWNILGTSIHDNFVRNNTVINSGIHIENRWLPTDIDGKTLTYRFANNRVIDNTGSGIYLYNVANGSGTLRHTSIEHSFTDNTVQGSLNGNGIYSRLDAYLTDPNATIADSSFRNTFVGNTIGGSAAGQGNSYDGISSEIALYTYGDTSPVSNTTLASRFENNVVIGNGGDGISDDYLDVYTGGRASGVSRVTISRYVAGNEIRGNVRGGFTAWDTTARTWGADSPVADVALDSRFDNNTILGNGQNAIEYWQSYIASNGAGSAVSRATVANTFSQNRLDATAIGTDAVHINTTYIRSTGTGSPLTDVSIDNAFTGNTLDGAGSAAIGIEIESNNYILASNADSPIGNARLTTRFEGNTVSNFAGAGLWFPGNYIRTGPFIALGGDATNSPISGATINNIVINNSVTDNNGHGIYNWRNEIKTQAGVTAASTNNTYTGNTIDRNGQNGIYLDEDFGGGANTGMNYSFTNNFIRNNGGDGLYLYIDPSNSDQILKRLLLQGNTITDNGLDGVDVYINGVAPHMFRGDFGGGALGSTGGNTFSGNGGWDINHGGSSNMAIWAFNNTWTNSADPESTVWDWNDLSNGGDVLTAPPE